MLRASHPAWCPRVLVPGAPPCRALAAPLLFTPPLCWGADDAPFPGCGGSAPCRDPGRPLCRVSRRWHPRSQGGSEYCDLVAEAEELVLLLPARPLAGAPTTRRPLGGLALSPLAGANTFKRTRSRVPWRFFQAYIRRSDGFATIFVSADAVCDCWLSRAWRRPFWSDCIPARRAARVSDVAAYVFNDALIAFVISRWHRFDCVQAARTSASPRTSTLTGPKMALLLVVIFVAFIGLLAPTPDAGRWDRRPLCIGKRFVVNAKESTPSDKD